MPSIPDYLATNNSEQHRSDGRATAVTFVAMVLGVMFNLIFLAVLLAVTGRKSRLRLYLVHLAMANLFVCFFTVALELGWRLTIAWVAGDFMCRVLSLTKTLGLYAESYVVVAMAADHYCTVMHPRSPRAQTQRGRMLLAMSWTCATIFSIPQAVVFHEEQDVNRFKQCVTINSFLSENAENAYVTFGLLAMYGVPLVAILFINLLLIIRVQSSSSSSASRQSPPIKPPAIKINHLEAASTSPKNSCNYSDIGSRNSSFQAGGEDCGPGVGNDTPSTEASQLRVRCHTGFQIRHTEALVYLQARRRALRLSVVMILTFLVACSPYAVTISSLANKAPDLEDIDRSFTEGLLIFTLCLSSLINPLFYGVYVCYDKQQWGAVEKRLPKNWELQVNGGQRPAEGLAESRDKRTSMAVERGALL